MNVPRLSGLLLHPTSLPGRFGVGELGPDAHRFVEFLERAGQQLWQVLPLGPTGYGDSPYQCFSAFAGNPLLVSLEELRAVGLLTDDDLKHEGGFPAQEVDFGPVIDWRLPLLRTAWHAFDAKADPAQKAALEAFRQARASWLPDYALFMALKESHDWKAWHEWPEELRARDKSALDKVRGDLREPIAVREFAQFLFFAQWGRLHAACKKRGIRIMGDIPIFVSADSADVWAHPELFQLEPDGKPTVVAGVPPDYFSATGQLWGNPLYRWDVMEKDGYRWWIERFKATLEMFDIVRLDHFRGFEAYWEIPGDAETAVDGRWVKAPGRKLFEAVQRALGPDLPIVAENLGVITPEVESLRESFGFPGMAILQFAFGSDSQANEFIPHNYPKNRVVYTGTHDNDTTVAWFSSAGTGDSTRTDTEVDRERALAKEYLKSDGTEIHWDFIRAALGSVAQVAIVPMQDVLGVGSEGRMNLPGRASGNWKWRFSWDAVTPQIEERLRRLTHIFGRQRPKTAEPSAAPAAPVATSTAR